MEASINFPGHDCDVPPKKLTPPRDSTFIFVGLGFFPPRVSSVSSVQGRLHNSNQSITRRPWPPMDETRSRMHNQKWLEESRVVTNYSYVILESLAGIAGGILGHVCYRQEEHVHDRSGNVHLACPRFLLWNVIPHSFRIFLFKKETVYGIPTNGNITHLGFPSFRTIERMFASTSY